MQAAVRYPGRVLPFLRLFVSIRSSGSVRFHPTPDGAVFLRAGTFQTSSDANGNQTTTLTNCAFATDVTVNGTVLWRTDRSVVADVTVTGSGVGVFVVSGRAAGAYVRLSSHQITDGAALEAPLLIDRTECS